MASGSWTHVPTLSEICFTGPTEGRINEINSAGVSDAKFYDINWRETKHRALNCILKSKPNQQNCLHIKFNLRKEE